VWQSGKIVLDVPELRAPSSQVTQVDDAQVDDLPELSTYGLHNLTGVNRVHDAGYAGQGVKVAVIDTGVFYNHPALGGGFGPGFKVSGGYDLVGSGYPGGDPIPDDDPHPEKMGTDRVGLFHGTHVAGIIAGESEW
jgi:subtilisin family serine protease